ncbi:unnamed protein product [Orchesella dallaii]|uniref:Gustatory receptor n=1 Tax=Orchesella dallaii TaxID=48710 RepID=A0ABP1Q006_9HEXA
MIEPEASTSLRVLNTNSVSIGDINSTTIKTDNRNFDNIISPQNLFVTNTIINGGKWVFLSNRLVAYWPFSIQTTQDTHQKYLSSSSERETKEKFRKLEKWGLKWFVSFTAIGIINGSAVFYNDLYNYNEPLLQVIIVEYIDTVISSHNASAFFLIFFIKIMTHGFTTCRRKLEQISNQNMDNTMFSTQNFHEQNVLPNIFKLIRDLEQCVSSFNTTFVFILFLEASFSFWQVMFALYFFHAVDPLSDFLAGINMMIPILSYSTCLVCLCKESSKLTRECQEMVTMLQELPMSTVENERKVQFLVSRLTSEPPAIQVSQLFYIRESLLSSMLNTLATYFIVLMQMRQMAHNTSPIVRDADQTNDNNSTINATTLDYQ